MQPARRPDLTVLIRFHTIRRLSPLDEALLSLLGQDGVSVLAVILCQDLPEADFEAVKRLAAIYNAQGITATSVNETFPERGDHRAELLNRGLGRVTTRYVAFLDCDDVVYPDCYATLIRRLQCSDAALAFGGVLRTDQFKSGGSTHVQRKFRALPDLPKLLFYRCNQYPIHSYVIDLDRIDRADAFFDIGHFRNEDYAFLVRLIAKYPIDTVASRDVYCEYRVDMDGGNTIPVFHADAASDRAWAISEQYVEDIKARQIIRTDTAEIKRLIAWCETDVANRYAGEIHTLGLRIQGLEAQLDQDRVRSDAMTRAFARHLSTVDPAAIHAALGLNVEHIEHREGGICRIRGWCAGQGNAPVMMALRDRRSSASAESAAEIYSDFHHRQDVADHLGSTTAHFGFEIETLSTDGVDVLCLCSDGNLYRAIIAASA